MDIYQSLSNSYDRYMVTFGSPSSSFLAYNDSIVLGFMYDEYYSERIDDKIRKNNYFKQLEYLKKIFNDIKKVGESK